MRVRSLRLLLAATSCLAGAALDAHADPAVSGFATNSALTFEIQSRVNALLLVAPLASPTLTGTPRAPTAAPLTNSTQIGTTAYTDAAAAVVAAASVSLAGAQTISGAKLYSAGAVETHDASVLFRTGGADFANGQALRFNGVSPSIPGQLFMSINGSNVWQMVSTDAASATHNLIQVNASNAAPSIAFLAPASFGAAATAATQSPLDASFLLATTGYADAAVAAGLTNLVNKTSSQSIGGSKTFTSPATFGSTVQLTSANGLQINNSVKTRWGSVAVNTTSLAPIIDEVFEWIDGSDNFILTSKDTAGALHPFFTVNASSATPALTLGLPLVLGDILTANGASFAGPVSHGNNKALTIDGSATVGEFKINVSLTDTLAFTTKDSVGASHDFLTILATAAAPAGVWKIPLAFSDTATGVEFRGPVFFTGAGVITLPLNTPVSTPTVAGGAANKGYVDTAIAAISGSTPPTSLPGGFQTGDFRGPQSNNANTAVAAANRLYALPVWVPNISAINLKTLSFSIGTVNASAFNARMCVYAPSSTTGLPNALLADGGLMAIAASATGVQTSPTITGVNLSLGYVWTAWEGDSTGESVFSTTGTLSMPWISPLIGNHTAAGGFGSNNTTGIYAASTVSSACPNPFPTPTYGFGGNPVTVMGF